jgi:hypothetical protein
MRHPPQPSGLSQGLPFLIDPAWTPEQAQAVIELLDDLREIILGHYQLQLHDLYREQRLGRPEEKPVQDADGPPLF